MLLQTLIFPIFWAKYFILPKQLPNTKSGWLAYPITISENAPFSRTQMQIFLEKKNIQTRVVFTGNILRQPGFKNINAIKDMVSYTNSRLQIKLNRFNEQDIIVARERVKDFKNWLE